MRPMRPIRQRRQPAVAVTADPLVHRLTGHPVALGDLDDRDATGQGLHHGVIALLHNAQLHEHQPRPLPDDDSRQKPTRGRERHPSLGVGVLPISRSRTGGRS